MRKIVLSLTILIGVCFVYSCSKANEQQIEANTQRLNEINVENYGGQEAQKREIDTALIVEKVNEAMVSFVQSIDKFYDDGMSYSQLKSELDPQNELSHISNIGDSLLYQAYVYLENGTPENEIQGQKLLEARKYFLEYNYNNGVENTNNINWDEESEVVFGYTVPQVQAKTNKCKWYQLGCHLAWVWDWLTGGDGMSPEEAIAIISTLISIINFASGL